MFWGCAFSGPSCQKKGIFGHPPKKNILTDNWKAHFLILSVFCFVYLFFCFLLFCCFVVLLFFLFFLFFLFVFCLFVLFFCFFCFFCCFCCFSFLSLVLSEKKPIFPLKRVFLFIFECLPLFLLSLFWPSTCSISVSLSLSCSFLSFVLIVFLVLLSFGSFFFSLSFFLFLSSLLLFHEN